MAEIKDLRTARGLSQTEVIDQMTTLGINWSQTTLSKIENNQRPLRIDEAKNLAVVLDVDLERLITGKRTLETPQEAAFRETLRDRRTARKLRQSDVATAMSKLGTTTDATTITRIEKGQVRPSLHQAILLTQVLDFTFDISGTQDPTNEQRERRLATLEGALTNIARECFYANPEARFS